MATFFMFGDYSNESISKISAKRTDETKAWIEKQGGSLISAYALLGQKDVVLLVDLPNTQAAMRTSAGLSKMLGISFSTYPAVGMDEFDRLMEDI